MTSAVVAGKRVWLRLLEPDDAALIRKFYWRLSPDTVYRRFLSPVVPPADRLVARLVDVDHHHRDALIGLDEDGIVGIARYGVDPSGSSYEVAVVVADEWQGKGLGRLLLRRLAHIARLRGISSFHATMLGDNSRVHALVRSVTPRAKMHYASGYVEAEIPLRPARS
jgi:GNAT superfamily N-acetyltransferase